MKKSARNIISIILLAIGSLIVIFAFLGGTDSASGFLILIGGILIFFGVRMQKKLKKINDDKVAADKIAAEELERQKSIDEWNLKFGKFDFRVAGVSYKNDDGTSRQAALKSAASAQKRNSMFVMTFEQGEYDGEPSVKVFINDKCVGFIEKDKVKQFLEIKDMISRKDVDIGLYTNDTGDTLFYCRVSLIYKKQTGY